MRSVSAWLLLQRLWLLFIAVKFARWFCLFFEISGKARPAHHFLSLCSLCLSGKSMSVHHRDTEGTEKTHRGANAAAVKPLASFSPISAPQCVAPFVDRLTSAPD